jgi:ribosomal protein L10
MMNNYTNAYQARIMARLKPATEEPKRQILLSMSQAMVDQLTQIAAELTKLSGVRVSRNAMIEEAIQAFLDESPNLLAEFREGGADDE